VDLVEEVEEEMDIKKVEILVAAKEVKVEAISMQANRELPEEVINKEVVAIAEVEDEKALDR